MEASGANNSEYSMFQYDAFITLDFQNILPACRQGYFHGIFQLIQLRNLGTKYWVYGVARKLRFGETVFGLVPLG